jgi:hypothetical protein
LRSGQPRPVSKTDDPGCIELLKVIARADVIDRDPTKVDHIMIAAGRKVRSTESKANHPGNWPEVKIIAGKRRVFWRFWGATSAGAFGKLFWKKVFFWANVLFGKGFSITTQSLLTLIVVTAG